MLLGDASPWSIAGAVAAVALLWLAAWILEWAWWTPRRLGRALRAQGLRGTRYRLFTGDVPENARLSREARLQPLPRGSHDITPRVQPMSCNVIKEHGKFFHREIHEFVTSEQAVFVSPSMCFLLEINSSQLYISREELQSATHQSCALVPGGCNPSRRQGPIFQRRSPAAPLRWRLRSSVVRGVAGSTRFDCFYSSVV